MNESEYVKLLNLLRPTIYITDVASGVDRQAYIASLADALFGDLGVEQQRKIASSIAARRPLQLADLADAIARLAPEQAKRLAEQLRGLDIAARRRLPRPNEQILKSYTSYALQPGHDAQTTAGPVVWVREGSQATVQFGLPWLTFDPVSGNVELDETPPSELVGPKPIAPPGLHAAVSGRQPAALMSASAAKDTTTEVLGDMVTLASSVSWALPPPWGAAATAALTLFQILLGVADKARGPDPFKVVQDNLENFIKQNEYVQIGTAFTDFANLLGDKSGTFDDVKFINTDKEHKELPGCYDIKARLVRIEDLLNWLKTSLTDHVHLACTEAVAELQRATLKDVQTPLKLACYGISLLLIGQKIYMQLLATRASYWYHNKEFEKYDIDATAWIDSYHEIRKSFGIDDPKNGDRWIHQVNHCINQLYNERIGKILEPNQIQEFRGDPNFPRWCDGWAWHDTALDESHGLHFYKQSPFNNDFAGWPDAHATAEATRERHIKGVKGDLDKIFGVGRQAVQVWANSLNAVGKLMPVARPDWAPTAEAFTDGQRTPQGIDWVKGNRVRYAVEYVNEKGPSSRGPWSEPITVGDFAYMKVSGLKPSQQDPDAKLHLYRQWTKAGTGEQEPIERCVKPSISPSKKSISDKMSFDSLDE